MPELNRIREALSRLPIASIAYVMEQADADVDFIRCGYISPFAVASMGDPRFGRVEGLYFFREFPEWREMIGKQVVRVLLRQRGADLGVIHLPHGNFVATQIVPWDTSVAVQILWSVDPMIAREAAAREAATRAEAESRASAERARQIVRQHIRIASHDLKAPIGNLLQYAALLEECFSEEINTTLPPNAATCLHHITSCASQLDRMVEGLRRFHRETIEKTETTSLSEAVGEALVSLQELVEQTGAFIDVTVSAVERCPANITVVLRNLVANSLKYRIADHAPRIAIRSTTDLASGTTTILVEDDGIGFDPRHATSLFGLFERLYHDDSVYGGDGVGLAIARDLVETNGGRIWAESEGTGKGATFRFTIPTAP